MTTDRFEKCHTSTRRVHTKTINLNTQYGSYCAIRITWERTFLPPHMMVTSLKSYPPGEDIIKMTFAQNLIHSESFPFTLSSHDLHTSKDKNAMQIRCCSIIRSFDRQFLTSRHLPPLISFSEWWEDHVHCHV